MKSSPQPLCFPFLFSPSSLFLFFIFGLGALGLLYFSRAISSFLFNSVSCLLAHFKGQPKPLINMRHRFLTKESMPWPLFSALKGERASMPWEGIDASPRFCLHGCTLHAAALSCLEGIDAQEYASIPSSVWFPAEALNKGWHRCPSWASMPLAFLLSVHCTNVQKVQKFIRNSIEKFPQNYPNSILMLFNQFQCFISHKHGQTNLCNS